MKKTREQRLTELLEASTTNITATSMVHARITNSKAAGLAWFFFGIVGWLLAGGTKHDESGFAMIDKGKIYFYKVTGLGRRQTIEGRREIVFDQLERVRRVKGGWTPAALNIRWRNNNNKRLDLSLGGGASRQFPNNQAHINELTQLILANKIEIKPDNSTRNAILWIVGVFVAVIGIIALAYLHSL